MKLDRPREAAHGDYATNVSLRLAKPAGRPPRQVAEVLAERGIEVVRSLVGDYVTSLEMQGLSLSLLKLDDELLELWDAPVQTIALRWGR